MERLKEVFAIANNKGGVAKTTTTQNLAAGILREQKGSKVLVIDLDPQPGCVSVLMGWNRESQEPSHMPTVYEALRDASSLPVYQSRTPDGKAREGFYFCPSHSNLVAVEVALHQYMIARKVLSDCFAQPLDNHTEDASLQTVMDFDYIIIDCPPAMGDLTFNAFDVATQLIIPISLEGMSYMGISGLVSAYKQAKEKLNPNLELLGFLKVMTNGRLNTAKGFNEQLERKFGDYMFKTSIRRSDVVNQSQTLGKTIFEYAPYQNPGLDYTAFVKEVLSKVS